MKYILIFLATLISTATIGQSQYEAGMKNAFELWTNQNTNEAVALFERIGQAEKENWLPIYYAANVLISNSFSIEEEEKRMSTLEKAKKYIKEAHERSENNDEIYTLEGLLYTAYVAFDPGTYAMQYSQKIMELHNKAININPNNPRALANKIEYEMGGAKFFNQDLKPYCDQLQDILVKFDQQNSQLVFAPKYGKERVLEIIQDCGK